MADNVNILELTESTDPTGATFYTVIGGVDYKITYANLVKLITGQAKGFSPPIVRLNNTGAQAQAILANSFVEKISVSIASGSPTIKAGTTVGGNDIFDSLTPPEIGIVTDLYFPTSGSIYFTITGGNVNIQIDYKILFQA